MFWQVGVGLLLLTSHDFVRLEVCSYTEDRRGYTRPDQEYSLIRHFWVDPDRVAAIGFEFMQPGQELQCSRLYFVGGGQLLVIGTVDEVRHKLAGRDEPDRRQPE